MNILSLIKRSPLFFLLLCNCLMVGTTGAAPFDQRTINELKDAVVFIRNGNSSGSGFLIQRNGKHGLIVTNQHVVDGIPPKGPVHVVFHSGQSNQRPLRGILEVAVPALDLALITVQAQSLPTPISRKPRPPVYETESVFALGFPFGNQLATNRETPRITITAGSVTSLRSDLNDQALYIQTDAAIDPGNSGGPVVDQEGNLLGITVAKLDNTSIGFVIPRRRLEQLLQGELYDIDLEIERKWLDSERWLYHLEASSQVYYQGDQDIEVGLHLIKTDRKTALEAMQPDQSWHGIQGKIIHDLPLKNRQGSNTRTGFLEIPSNLKGSLLVVQPYVKLADRMIYQAPLWLDLEQGSEDVFSFDGPNKATTRKHSSDTRPAAPHRGPEGNAKNRPTRGTDGNAQEDGSRRNRGGRQPEQHRAIQLPGVIDSLALVGGGRYLALAVDADTSVVLLDLQQQKLIPLDLQLDEPALVAGDKKNVYIAGTYSGKLLRWSFQEKAVVETGFSPNGAPISAIASGWDAQEDTLLLITPEYFEFLDTTNFKPRQLTWKSAQYGNDRRPYVGHEGAYMTRASGNGKIYTFWGTKHSPAGVNVLRLRGNQVIHYNEHDTAGFVVPDRTGNRVYTGMKGAYTNTLAPLDAEYLQGSQLIPSIRGDHLLRVNYQHEVRVTLVRVADGEIQGTVRVPELKADGHPYSYHRKRPTGDQRFWLSEDNGLLYVIPDSNDRVVIYTLQMDL